MIGRPMLLMRERHMASARSSLYLIGGSKQAQGEQTNMKYYSVIHVYSYACYYLRPYITTLR